MSFYLAHMTARTVSNYVSLEEVQICDSMSNSFRRDYVFRKKVSRAFVVQAYIKNQKGSARLRSRI